MEKYGFSDPCGQVNKHEIKCTASTKDPTVNLYAIILEKALWCVYNLRFILV